MAGQELKASEKKVLKMTKDGAVEQNLVNNSTEKVSKRTEEAVLKQEASPELLAKYKAAGIAKPSAQRRQYTNLKFGNNNPDKPTEDDNGDHQQSEQTISAVMPVVSISFTPKKVDKEFLTRNINKQRKKQRKEEKRLEKEKLNEDIADNPEDSPDLAAPEESKLKEGKSRNTLEEHSAASDSLKEESEDSPLLFDDEAENVEIEETVESKPIEKPEMADVAEISEAPDVPSENEAQITESALMPEIEESKLKEGKNRNTLEEHSAAADNLKEESEDSSLLFDDEAENVEVEETIKSKPIEKPDMSDVAEISEAPDIPIENEAQITESALMPEIEESKLKEGKSRNTLEEHSTAADSLKEESEDSPLLFEDEAESVKFEEAPTKKQKKEPKMTDVSEAPDVPIENEAPKTKSEKRLEKQVGKDEKKFLKAEKRLEKAEKKLPTERVVTFNKKPNAKTGKPKRKLRFEKEIKPSDRKLPFSSEVKDIKQTVKTTVSGTIHNEIAKYEEDNPTLKAAHSTEKVAESALHTAESALKTAYQDHKSAPYRKVSKLKFQKEKAEQKLSYHKALSEHPELRPESKKAAAKAAMKKAQQKQNQKNAAKGTKKVAEKVKEAAEEVGKKIVQVIVSNKWVIIILVVLLIVFALFGTLCTSCCSSFVDNGTVMLATTYTSEDEDIYAANDYMTSLENGLSDYINHIPDYYVGWNEYNYHIDNIGHDPYQLTSFLSAMRIAFQYDADIQNMINELYNEIYTLDVVSTHEVRSYTYTEIDDEGNETEVTVYYDYFILDVYLTTQEFESVIRPKLEAAGVYDLYLVMQSNQGGKPNLF